MNRISFKSLTIFLIISFEQSTRFNVFPLSQSSLTVHRWHSTQFCCKRSKFIDFNSIIVLINNLSSFSDRQRIAMIIKDMISMDTNDDHSINFDFVWLKLFWHIKHSHWLGLYLKKIIQWFNHLYLYGNYSFSQLNIRVYYKRISSMSCSNNWLILSLIQFQWCQLVIFECI